MILLNCTFRFADYNSIDSIGAESAPAEYFDVLGRRVLRPSKGDILIERRGTETRKIVVR